MLNQHIEHSRIEQSETYNFVMQPEPSQRPRAKSTRQQLFKSVETPAASHVAKSSEHSFERTTPPHLGLHPIGLFH
ncbi:hypothetical protein D3C85_882640 [compost metagenome]